MARSKQTTCKLSCAAARMRVDPNAELKIKPTTIGVKKARYQKLPEEY